VKEEEEMRMVSEGKDEGKEKNRSGWGMDGWGVVGRSGEGAWIGGEGKGRDVQKKKSALNSVLIGI